MKRGFFFAFCCALIVGLISLAMVSASFLRPDLFRSYLVGENLRTTPTAGEAIHANAEIVDAANHGVVTVLAIRATTNFENPAAGSPAAVQRGAGTGIIIDRDGYIITNEHVIKDAQRIRIKLDDGRDFDAVVKGYDRATDLALLKIEADGLKPLAFGDSDILRVGDPVIAIGNPVEYERTVTAGIVSAKGRKVYGKDPFEDFIQTDAAINRGNSGGPLLNQSGEVIGVNTVIRTDASGISFAVPSNVVNRVITQLRIYGHVSRGYLGLTPVNLTQEFRDGLGLGAVKGVLVADVAVDLPAARAGIKAYDIITHFDGRAIRHADDFFACVANSAPQRMVELDVIRGGEHLTFHATLDRRPIPEEPSAPETKPAADRLSRQTERTLGFSVLENTQQVLQELRIGGKLETVSGGVVVSEIDPLSLAAESRLSVGHIIVEANRQPIRNLEDFQRVVSTLKPGSALVIRFTPPDAEAYSMAAIRLGAR
jgi:serine protease Do